MEKKKYISVSIPRKDENGDWCNWWVPDHGIKAIEILESENPNYEFVQIVTSPNNGGWKEYAIMKLKK